MRAQLALARRSHNKTPCKTQASVQDGRAVCRRSACAPEKQLKVFHCSDAFEVLLRICVRRMQPRLPLFKRGAQSQRSSHSSGPSPSLLLFLLLLLLLVLLLLDLSRASALTAAPLPLVAVSFRFLSQLLFFLFLYSFQFSQRRARAIQVQGYAYGWFNEPQGSHALPGPWLSPLFASLLAASLLELQLRASSPSRKRSTVLHSLLQRRLPVNRPRCHGRRGSGPAHSAPQTSGSRPAWLGLG